MEATAEHADLISERRFISLPNPKLDRPGLEPRPDFRLGVVVEFHRHLLNRRVDILQDIEVELAGTISIDNDVECLARPNTPCQLNHRQQVDERFQFLPVSCYAEVDILGHVVPL